MISIRYISYEPSRLHVTRDTSIVDPGVEARSSDLAICFLSPQAQFTEASKPVSNIMLLVLDGAGAADEVLCLYLLVCL